ncbi:Gfo/Idh/MocA family protein [Sphingomonas hankookensis]|uniref:Gfo/Idh/MocA family protein n=1 Tax=Sphingomonas hankookensis TaxID=563996 RepID=UPI001F596467|nr:Gfo/Idh/MocA family oxidoreductase [Sphingomonas hankookensis]
MTTRHEPLKLAMAGGGEGAFIGAIHRKAAALDGDWRLVAGTFSSDAARNDCSGAVLGLDPARVYPTIDALIAAECALPQAERIDALAIVTPNHLHAPMAIAALEAGIHVFCEKPMAMNSAEAQAIAAAAQRGGAKFALAFTYSGYPLVEEARVRVSRGDLGKIRLVQVEYLQGWLSLPIDGDGNKQAAWRTDPAKAGMGGCLGDIGTHAFHLAEHVSGVRVDALCADLTAHVPGRRLDDDVGALLRFEGGARGTLKASQVAAGEENGLKLRVSGEHGTLEWAQMEPNTLTLRWLDRPAEVVRAGGPGLSPSTQALLRTPSGHPEGYIEAFANLYQGFAAQLQGRDDRFVPGLADGLRTMAFIEAMIANAQGDDKWTPVSGRVSGEYR